MIIFKWLLVALVSLDFVEDYIKKIADTIDEQSIYVISKKAKITTHIGALIGLVLSGYVVYILIMLWVLG